MTGQATTQSGQWTSSTENIGEIYQSSKFTHSFGKYVIATGTTTGGRGRSFKL